MTSFLAVVLLVWAGGQGVAYSGASSERLFTAGVLAMGEIPVATVRTGDTTTVVIPIEIADGYHVQANPASNEFLIPLELELQLEEPDSLVSWRPVYPPAGRLRLEGTTEDLLTYHGSIGIEVLVYSSEQARNGERIFTGALSYQACDTQRCLFPTSVPVRFKVVISGTDI